MPIMSVPDSNNCTKILTAAGRSLAKVLRIFFKFYIFGFSRQVFRMWLKPQASNLLQLLIRPVLNRKLRYIPKRVWPE